MPLFFCPLDDITCATPATLDDQRAAIGTDGRERSGLCVEAEDEHAAGFIATAYLEDCIRAGTPRGDVRGTMATMREGVPVVTMTGTYRLPTDDERRALAKILASARGYRKRDGFTDTRDAAAGSTPPDNAGSMT